MALNPWQIVDWFKKKEDEETIAEKYPDGYSKEWHEHKPKEHGGPEGAEPTRFGTWENKGREIDF